MDKEEIIKFLEDHKADLENNFGVMKIGLFGSHARGDAREDSDVDIIVELKSENISDHYFSLLHFLEDTFKRKIDLGIASSIKPEIKEYVDRDIIYV